ncbi:DNA annealing helicase and endonuclease ZRANB3-like isoform X2 [Nematostella vectensis]|uniref:DNA annealing helicase and endonuclease ZRANB3-like isoform X2 n=1 Tax=Nematostella vectensis TaxID=45351 RepID=UPI0020778B12|nr:DNA annealing helicase and endonuclease ZRANB3-like isoform X2 [Nematostella vectensis]
MAASEPTSLDFLPDALRNALLDFQRTGIQFAIKNNGRCLIGDEMGLGKTLQAISVAYYYKDEWPLLIVVPSSMKYPWIEEIEKWLPDIEPTDINLIRSGTDVCNIPTSKINVIGYGLIGGRTSFKLLNEALKEQKFKVIILDESHYLKNRKASRTKTLHPMARDANRALLLSGTPSLARPEELYIQLDIVRPKMFGSFSNFAKRYCEAYMETIGKFKKWNTRGASNLAELYHRLHDGIMIRRQKKHVLTQLPPKRRQKITFDLPDSEHKKAGSVQQYLGDLLDGADNKFIVFCRHKLVMDAVVETIAKRGVKYIRIAGDVPSSVRGGMVHRFQEDPTCRIAVLAIEAASFGLTLTAADQVVFAELHFTPGVLLQAEDRAHRIGQTNAVNIHYLVGRGTLDEVLWTKIQRKLMVTSSALDGQMSELQADDGDEATSRRLASCAAWIQQDITEDDDDDTSFLFTQRSKKSAKADNNQMKLHSFFSQSSSASSNTASPRCLVDISSDDSDTDDLIRASIQSEKALVEGRSCEENIGEKILLLNPQLTPRKPDYDESLKEKSSKKISNHPTGSVILQTLPCNNESKSSKQQIISSPKNHISDTPQTLLEIQEPGNVLLDLSKSPECVEPSGNKQVSPGRESSDSDVTEPQTCHDTLGPDAEGICIIRRKNDLTSAPKPSLENTCSVTTIGSENIPRLTGSCGGVTPPIHRIKFVSSRPKNATTTKHFSLPSLLSHTQTQDGEMCYKIEKSSGGVADITNKDTKDVLLSTSSVETSGLSVDRKSNRMQGQKELKVHTASDDSDSDFTENKSLTPFSAKEVNRGKKPTSKAKKPSKRKRPSLKTVQKRPKTVPWSCVACTFVNDPSMIECSICFTARNTASDDVADTSSKQGISKCTFKSSDRGLGPEFEHEVIPVRDGSYKGRTSSTLTATSLKMKGENRTATNYHMAQELGNNGCSEQSIYSTAETSESSESMISNQGPMSHSKLESKVSEQLGFISDQNSPNCYVKVSECSLSKTPTSSRADCSQTNNFQSCKPSSSQINATEPSTHPVSQPGSSPSQTSTCSQVNPPEPRTPPSWICGACTLENDWQLIECSVCMTPRRRSKRRSNSNNSNKDKKAACGLNSCECLLPQVEAQKEKSNVKESLLNDFPTYYKKKETTSRDFTDGELKTQKTSEGTCLPDTKNTLARTMTMNTASVDETMDSTMGHTSSHNSLTMYNPSLVNSTAEKKLTPQCAKPNALLASSSVRFDLRQGNCKNDPNSLTMQPKKRLRLEETILECPESSNELLFESDSNDESKSLTVNDGVENDNDDCVELGSTAANQNIHESLAASHDDVTSNDDVRSSAVNQNVPEVSVTGSAHVSQGTAESLADLQAAAEVIFGDDDEFSETFPIESSLPDPISHANFQETAESSRKSFLDRPPQEPRKLLFSLSFYTDRVYLYNENGDPLCENFLTNDVCNNNLADLPHTLQHEHNLKQAKRMVQEMTRLGEGMRRLVRKSGLIFSTPVEAYQCAFKMKKQLSSTKRHMSKEARVQRVVEAATKVGGETRIVTKDFKSPKRKRRSCNSTQVATKQELPSTPKISGGSPVVSGSGIIKSHSSVQAFCPDGTALCLYCEGRVDYGAKGTAWDARFCSYDCKQDYQIRVSGTSVRRNLFEAEHGVCQLCRLDAHALFQSVKAIPKKERRAFLETSQYKDLPPVNLNRMILEPKEGMFWEADHIQAVAEGGGECGMDNFRTLCIPCHRRVTADLLSKLKKKRKRLQVLDIPDISTFFHPQNT